MEKTKWNPGDKSSCPFNEMVSLDLKALSTVDIYKLLIGTIIPRPIAFVSTISDSGVVNLAPFSFFNGVASNPPTVVFSVSRKRDGQKKDTLRNIEQNKEFVINMVSEWISEAANHTSAEYPYGISELEKVGLTALPSTTIKPPRVKESPVQMECVLYDLMNVGGESAGSATLVVGEIRTIHIAESAYKDGLLLLDQLKPVSRLGGKYYGRTTDIFKLERPVLPLEDN
ncbi:MAG: flavin reductase family protein [Bdellovibrionales bacterium]|nr:flavin reductase family protein [Bdellovibrionales bacterium]